MSDYTDLEILIGIIELYFCLLFDFLLGFGFLILGCMGMATEAYPSLSTLCVVLAIFYLGTFSYGLLFGTKSYYKKHNINNPLEKLNKKGWF